ncbi:hypothetical protein PPL_01771 [Heterostelium album PN500]|uniref:Homeobox domain-containing protein n=1 Tax=Heterostelium pallidum (strain ATCC 26659 / Pp 5 / PN500) TaxID=670386 RepID=D3B0F5_HETP5|nr:hypothetical protein PPL_01771 [Heterostelium album PN500]EFA84779.1 hypothetical protein PPL_01771 [Heterostelium album PN500]|eukprot:XP_020436891.1 hypothetical protein PPL_01771 [Heterostelium album PN500]
MNQNKDLLEYRLYSTLKNDVYFGRVQPETVVNTHDNDFKNFQSLFKKRFGAVQDPGFSEYVQKYTETLSRLGDISDSLYKSTQEYYNHYVRNNKDSSFSPCTLDSNVSKRKVNGKFTPLVKAGLMNSFQKDIYPTREKKLKLAKKYYLTEKQVSIWFTNSRKRRLQKKSKL